MGGIPVDKSKPGIGLTEVAIENMSKLNGSLLAISPEGTRAKTDKLKSGFLRIAPVSYKNFRAHETKANTDARLLLEHINTKK